MKVEFTKERLKKVIRKMQSVKVLVLGDLMLDDFIWGKVTRISPEAPVPVVLVTKESAYPGGAANVGRNLVDFGISAEMCGLIGTDSSGEKLLELLKHAKIGTQGVVKKKDFPTIRKSRIIARTQQVVRVDREIPYRLEKAILEKLTPFLEKKIAEVDAVVIEDYGKGFITQDLIDVVAALARQHKKIITVDPNPNNPLNWCGVTAVKPNKQEAFATLGMPQSDDLKQCAKIGETLVRKWGVLCVLMTMGEDGMILVQPPEAPYHVPTRAQEVFDVSGAGDTVIAFFTAALAAGLNMKEAAEIANHAAGVVVGKLGTATLTPDELIASWEKTED